MPKDAVPFQNGVRDGAEATFPMPKRFDGFTEEGRVSSNLFRHQPSHLQISCIDPLMASLRRTWRTFFALPVGHLLRQSSRLPFEFKPSALYFCPHILTPLFRSGKNDEY